MALTVDSLCALILVFIKFPLGSQIEPGLHFECLERAFVERPGGHGVVAHAHSFGGGRPNILLKFVMVFHSGQL